jgi:hypothetical protein
MWRGEGDQELPLNGDGNTISESAHEDANKEISEASLPARSECREVR